MSSLQKTCLKFLCKRNFKKNVCFARHLCSQNEEYVLKSQFKEVQLSSATIPEFFYNKFEKYSHLVATECGVTGKKYTYDEIRIKSRNFGKALRKKLKLQKGDVVAVLLPNLAEYVIVVLGCLNAGLVVTTINPIYTPDEVSRHLLDSSAKTVITLDNLYSPAKTALGVAKKDLPIITIKFQSSEPTPKGAIDFYELTENNIDGISDFVDGNAQDLAFLPYSSGTTGLPKGVELTHFNLTSNMLQGLAEEVGIARCALDYGQDVLPVVLPMFHIYGLNLNTLAPIQSGCKVITLPKFTPESYINILKNNDCTILYTVPPILLFLTLHPDVKKEYFKKSRIVMSGAAPLGPSDEERFIQKVNNEKLRIIQGYGLTETSPSITVRNDKVPGTIGKVMSNTEVKIIDINDPNGKALGPNVTGEMLVRGPQVMKRYHNKPKETKEAFLGDWLRTGDVGYYDENQNIFLTDRLKELIKVKGFQVPPAELEEVIRDFPNIIESAVIGVPDEKYGEIPRAFVVIKPGSEVDTNKLLEFVNDKVAHYKQLKGGIDIVTEIPKNASGKILRRQIKLDYLSKKQ